MKQSESISKLASALVRAQGQLRHAKENAVNPHFKNSYADLSSVIDTVKPIFAECGLAVIQFETFESPNIVSVETVLLHESGEFISEKSGCLAVKADPQGIGSAITYLRRYSLAALAGITQSDDDGETQRPVKTEPAKKAEPPKQAEQEEKQKPIYQAGDIVDERVYSAYNSKLGREAWEKKYPDLIVGVNEGIYKVLKK